MPYYLLFRSSDGRANRVDNPYENFFAARGDAEVGAKQIVGDALYAGASLRAMTEGRKFEIVDEAGKTIASLPFIELIGAEGKN